MVVPWFLGVWKTLKTWKSQGILSKYPEKNCLQICFIFKKHDFLSALDIFLPKTDSAHGNSRPRMVREIYYFWSGKTGKVREFHYAEVLRTMSFGKKMFRKNLVLELWPETLPANQIARFLNCDFTWTVYAKKSQIPKNQKNIYILGNHFWQNQNCPKMGEISRPIRSLDSWICDFSWSVYAKNLKFQKIEKYQDIIFGPKWVSKGVKWPRYWLVWPFFLGGFQESCNFW